MLDHAKPLIETHYAARGVTREGFDEERVFAFGYSAGGMMAFKYASYYNNRFAAMVLVCSACGGRQVVGGSTFTNNPILVASPPGMSLMLYVGGADPTVPPGGLTSTGLQPSVAARDALEDSGLTSTEASDFCVNYRSARTSTQAYLDFNHVIDSSFNDDFLNPDTNTTGQPDVGGGTQRSTRTWRGTSGNNPVVKLVYDVVMTHDPTAGDRQLTIDDVWSFFKNHPRP
jgi:pimeloyl-ACP methyl ester carboxylesterase